MKTQIIKFLETEKEHCKTMATLYHKVLDKETNVISRAAVGQNIDHFQGRLKQIELTLDFIHANFFH